MRIFSSSVRVALKALQVNRMRTSLTMLGVVIGVGAVIAMSSIGAGAEEQIGKQIASLGSNVLIVQPGSQNVGGVRQGSGAAQTLTREDATALAQQVPTVAAAAPVARGNSQVIYGNRNWFTRITGTTPEYFPIHTLKLAEGVSFTALEEAGVAKVAVLGPTVRNALFGDEPDVLGREIRINQISFKVIGILAPKGQSPSGQDQDDTILVPFSTALKRVLGRTGARANLVSNIDLQARSEEAVPLAEQQVSELLRYRHQLAANEPDDFRVRALASRYEVRQEAAEVMSLLLASIAAVSLLVGGIGIMNIMLVSVTERTREIGLRQAMGAKTRDILMQFLTEAVTVSLAGGVAGIGVGILLSLLVGYLTQWPVALQWDTALLAFGFAGFVGIFFGYYPARKAALLNPIDALRYE